MTINGCGDGVRADHLPLGVPRLAPAQAVAQFELQPFATRPRSCNTTADQKAKSQAPSEPQRWKTVDTF